MLQNASCINGGVRLALAMRKYARVILFKTYRSNRLMRETTKERLKHYSKLTKDITFGALYWVPLIGLVYACMAYQIVYGRYDK